MVDGRLPVLAGKTAPMSVLLYAPLSYDELRKTDWSRVNLSKIDYSRVDPFRFDPSQLGLEKTGFTNIRLSNTLILGEMRARFDMTASDNNYIAAHDVVTGDIWISAYRPLFDPLFYWMPGCWHRLDTRLKDRISIQDIAYGCDDPYEIGTVYAMTDEKKFLFCDVWSFAHGFTWQPVPDMPEKYKTDLTVESRIDSSRSALVVTGMKYFYGTWYNYHFWTENPVVKWTMTDVWCRGSYPRLPENSVLDTKSFRVKRRLERISIKEDIKKAKEFFGSRMGQVPTCNYPSDAVRAGQYLSRDGEAPLDLMFNGIYQGIPGLYYARLNWRLEAGVIDTDWYFRPGFLYPESLEQFTNIQGIIRLNSRP